MLTIEQARIGATPAAFAKQGVRAEAAANDFAASFIAEMLSLAGFEDALASGAGFGGEAMSGFLMRGYAEKIVERGGFGFVDLLKDRLALSEIADAPE